MKKRSLALMVILIAVSAFAWADDEMASKDKKDGMSPKPGPELARLQPFVGHWKMESETMKNDMFPAGKGTGSETCEWFKGGYYLVCKEEGKGPMGEEKGLGILGYDPEEKVYTYYGIDNMGMGSYSKGSVEGDTWTWNNEMKMGGKVIKSRFSMKEDSATVHTMSWAMSSDGETWSTMMTGKETKMANSASEAKKPKAETKK